MTRGVDADGFQQGLRRHMFADAETAAVKGDLTPRIGGFVDNEHFGITFWTFHTLVPRQVCGSIVVKKEITICCGFICFHILYVVVVSISQGREFFSQPVQ